MFASYPINNTPCELGIVALNSNSRRAQTVNVGQNKNFET